MSGVSVAWVRQHVPGFPAYYRSLLGEPDRRIYDQVRDQVLAHTEQFRVPCGDRSRLSVIMDALRDDCPWIFSVRGYQNRTDAGGTLVAPDYRMTVAEAEAHMSQLLDTATALARSFRSQSPEETALRLHDHFCTHYTYDRAEERISFTPLGPAERSKGVCSGISMMAKCVFDLLHIPSLLVNGQSWNQQSRDQMESHSWLMVDMGRGYRHMDITQDMVLCAKGLIRHDYFSMSDEESRLRRIPAGRNNPRAAAGDWYAERGLSFPSTEALARYLRSAISDGQQHFEFRLPRSFAAEPRKSAALRDIIHVLYEAMGPGEYGSAANDANGVWGLFIRPDVPAQGRRTTPSDPSRADRYAAGTPSTASKSPASATEERRAPGVKPAPGRQAAIPRLPVGGASATPYLDWCRRYQPGYPTLCRDRLPEAARRVYDEMRSRVFGFAEQFDVKCDGGKAFQAVVDALHFDCPWMFFLDHFDYREHLFSRTITVMPRYGMNEREAERHMGRLLQSAHALAEDCAGLSRTEAVLHVHDAICGRYRFVDDGHSFSASPLGPVERGSAVCSGLCLYTKCVFDLLSIPSQAVAGEAEDSESGEMMDHAWMLVNLDGHFYHMDVTFDLCVTVPGLIRHDSFMMSDREASRDRTVPDDLPRADTPGRYYRDRGLSFRFVREAEAFLRQAFSRGEDHLEFQMTLPEAGGPSEADVDGLIDRMIDSDAPNGRYYYGQGKRGVWFLYAAAAQ